MKSNIVKCPNCGKRNRVPAAADGKPRCGTCHKPLPWIVAAGDQDFTEVVDKSAVPVLVDLWASWCSPCRMVSPALEQLATERAGQLKLVKVDVDANRAVSERFGVQAVPTLLVLDHGQLLSRQSGATPVGALRHWLDQALSMGATKEAKQ